MADKSQQSPYHFVQLGVRDYGHFQPKDTMSVTVDTGLVSAVVGGAVAIAKTNLAKPSYVERGALMKNLPLVGYFSATGAAFAFVDCVLSNLREKDDAYNSFWGGFAAGAILGAKRGTMGAFLTCSMCVGSLMGIFSWSGGFLGLKDQSLEAYRKKFVDFDRTELPDGEEMRLWDRVHRAPLSQTIKELGPGRGVPAKLPSSE